jgi:hypothetical protein
MNEANWGRGTMSPGVDWRMSAALENVPRGESDLAEVTSLAAAIAAWQALDPAYRANAVLTPERPLVIDGVSVATLKRDAISALADRLGESGRRAGLTLMDASDAVLLGGS